MRIRFKTSGRTMGKGRAAGGRVRWDLPSMPQPRSPEDIAAIAAKYVAKRFRERLRRTASAPGLARWLADRVEVVGGVVSWPHFPAVDRLGLSEMDRTWLGGAMREALKAEQK